jgi:hypothetical protein
MLPVCLSPGYLMFDCSFLFVKCPCTRLLGGFGLGLGPVDVGMTFAWDLTVQSTAEGEFVGCFQAKGYGCWSCERWA